MNGKRSSPHSGNNSTNSPDASMGFTAALKDLRNTPACHANAVQADDIADDQFPERGDSHNFPASLVLPLKRSAGLGIAIVDKRMFSAEKIVGMVDLRVFRDLIG